MCNSVLLTPNKSLKLIPFSGADVHILYDYLESNIIQYISIIPIKSAIFITHHNVITFGSWLLLCLLHNVEVCGPSLENHDDITTFSLQKGIKFKHAK